VATRKNEIVNRLEKTKKWEEPDLQAALIQRQREERTEKAREVSSPPALLPPLYPPHKGGLLHTSKSSSWLCFSSPWLYLYWHVSRILAIITLWAGGKGADRARGAGEEVERGKGS
jgi:hypothetical protein